MLSSFPCRDCIIKIDAFMLSGSWDWFRGMKLPMMLLLGLWLFFPPDWKTKSKQHSVLLGGWETTVTK